MNTSNIRLKKYPVVWRIHIIIGLFQELYLQKTLALFLTWDIRSVRREECIRRVRFSSGGGGGGRGVAHLLSCHHTRIRWSRNSRGWHEEKTPLVTRCVPRHAPTLGHHGLCAFPHVISTPSSQSVVCATRLSGRYNTLAAGGRCPYVWIIGHKSLVVGQYSSAKDLDLKGRTFN